MYFIEFIFNYLPIILLILFFISLALYFYYRNSNAEKAKAYHRSAIVLGVLGFSIGLLYLLFIVSISSGVSSMMV